MKQKLLNALLILFSLTGYLEWGKGNHMFLFQAEADIILKLFTDPQSVLHPFILLPLAGQILLLITIFQKQPSRILTLVGLSGLSLLLLLLFIIGIMGVNIMMIACSLPFIVIAILTVRNIRLQRKLKNQGE